MSSELEAANGSIAIMGPVVIKPAGKKGRGVFAKEHIRSGALIERCPIIKVPREEVQYVDKTGLYNYYYAWDPDFEAAALMLGYGSIYNHSFRPNARFMQHFEEGYMDYTAIRDIAKGEEITVNYNGEPDDQDPLPYLTVEE